MKPETTYQSITFRVKGNTWSFMKARGGSNYIAIRKETNNPFKGLGKQFRDIEEACRYYKSPAMRVALIQADSQI